MSKKTPKPKSKTSKTPTKKTPKKAVLLVGNKPSMNYVLFTINQLQGTKE